MSSAGRRRARTAGISLVLGLAALARVGPARAQATPTHRRLAVLLLAGGPAVRETADTMNEVLIDALSGRPGLELVGRSEFQAQLGQNEAEVLRCSQSPACLGHVGAALGVDAILIGSLGQRGDAFLLNLNLVDIATAEVVQRRYEEVHGGVDRLVGVIQRLGPQLLAPRRRPASVVVETRPREAVVYLDEVRVGESPVRLPDVRPGRHMIRASRDGFRTTEQPITVAESEEQQVSIELERIVQAPSHTLRWIAIVGGGAAIAAAGTGGVFGFLSNLRDPNTISPMSQAVLVDESNRNQAALATGLFIGAGVLAVTAVILYLVSD